MPPVDQVWAGPARYIGAMPALDRSSGPWYYIGWTYNPVMLRVRGLLRDVGVHLLDDPRRVGWHDHLTGSWIWADPRLALQAIGGEGQYEVFRIVPLPQSPERTSITSASATTKARWPARGSIAAEPGKAAERGQDSHPLAQEEAGQALALKRGSGEHEPRVDVPGEGMALGGDRRLMAEDEGRHERGRVDAVDPKIIGRVTGVAIVIAPHQQDLQRRVQGAPAPQLGQRRGRDPTGAGVEEIAEHEEPARARAVEGRVQSRQVVARGSGRDRDPRRPERGGLAPMEVGGDERGRAGQNSARSGRSTTSSPARRTAHRSRAAPEAAAGARRSGPPRRPFQGAAIRRMRSANFSELTCSRARSTSSPKASGVGRSTSTTEIVPHAIRSSA